MIIAARGVKGLLILLAGIFVAIVILLIAFNLLIFLLPLIIVLVLLSYLFRILNKVKKGKSNDYINIDFRVRK